jgi:putative aldouronate transport system permease protein
MRFAGMTISPLKYLQRRTTEAGMGQFILIKKNFFHSWRLLILSLPAVIWLGIFMYGPMYGVIIAFKEYSPRLGINGSPWTKPLVKYFINFFQTSIAMDSIRNTFLLSVETLALSFPVPICFAVLLNKLRFRPLKKAIQTLTYAPYFVSTVVLVSILTMILAPSGFVNQIINHFTGKTFMFMTRPEYFRRVYVISHIWTNMGFSAIIYIAALTNINPDFYEAAIIDGASKTQMIRYIDIPMILPIIIIMFVLETGKIMTVGFEKAYLMQTGMNLGVSELISTYVYKIGLINSQYSFSTAVGLFNSVINFVLLLCSNGLFKKFASVSIF